MYFAEEVVQELSQKFDVWFDIQRLKPGMDWDADIKQGNDECAALVLIVSEAALHFPNVADEQRPIILRVLDSISNAPVAIPKPARLTF